MTRRGDDDVATQATTSELLGRAPAPAALALADGTIYRGRAFGATTVSSGEVVFNTSLTGYQEIATDPSYAGQIVTMTYTQIGNVGVNAADDAASGPRACLALLGRSGDVRQAMGRA